MTKLKILNKLGLNVTGKTYTINVSDKKHCRLLENNITVVVQTYYVIEHAFGGFSMIKDEKIYVTDIDDPHYNPYILVAEKAREEGLEIHHFEYWQKLYSPEKNKNNEKQKVLK